MTDLKQPFDREIEKFAHANAFREEIRSKGVWIFSVFRTFILRAGALNHLGDDIFMLRYNELFALLKGDRTALSFIEKRKEMFTKYRHYPAFPNLILGRFDPEEWLALPQRNDAFKNRRYGNRRRLPGDRYDQAMIQGSPCSSSWMSSSIMS